jgi:hypothetical protein
MVHTRTAIEYRHSAAAAIVPVIGNASRHLEEVTNAQPRLTAERAIDDVLADSFPASDPPSWNPGVARPQPWGDEPGDDVSRLTVRDIITDTASVIDVSRTGTERTFGQALVSLMAAGGIMLLLPLVILLIGLPFVLAVGGVIEALAWALGIVVR